jgi:uncharacterized membrane protein SirB2
MPYEIYKIIHVVFIVLFFSVYGMAAVKAKSGDNPKFEKMLTGIFLLLIMVGGMGLGARLGVLKGGWPLWINIKMAIWVIVGVGGTIVLKRKPQFSIKYFWFSSILLVMASYLANYKI